jgi:hypothetical protein
MPISSTTAAPSPGEPFNPHRRFHVACIPDPLLRSGLVSGGAKLAYGQLARYAGKDGRCFPKQSTLAAALAVSERQVRRYLRELEAAQLLRTTQRGLNEPNSYEFLWHAMFDDAASVIAHKPQIPQDRTRMSAQDRTIAAAPDRTLASGPISEEESHLPRESGNRGALPLPRSIEREPVRFAATAAAALTPSRLRHVHRRAVVAWPEADVVLIRRHLADLPCQDGSQLEITDELVGRLLNAAKLYMRTSFELGALLSRLAGRVRNRPSWWPESAGSTGAWLLAAIDREYGPDFVAARKPPGQETAADIDGEESVTAPATGGGDPAFAALIRQIAAQKALR